MFIIYVLYSETFDKIYIGYTANLENRIKSHNELGTNGYTLRYRPWTLAYSETADTKTEALKREKSINEVSDLAGYKNTTHFSAAFKRKFGLTPSQVKLQGYR